MFYPYDIAFERLSQPCTNFFLISLSLTPGKLLSAMKIPKFVVNLKATYAVNFCFVFYSCVFKLSQGYW